MEFVPGSIVANTVLGDILHRRDYSDHVFLRPSFRDDMLDMCSSRGRTIRKLATASRANLIVRNPCLEDKLFKLQKHRSSVELEMIRLRKRAAALDNLKLEIARSKKRLSQSFLQKSKKLSHDYRG